MANAYIPKKKMNAGREYRRGSLGTLIQNMNMASPHGGNTHAAGLQRQDYAERYNSGALPWQIEMQQLEESKLTGASNRDYKTYQIEEGTREGKSLRDYRQKSLYSKDLNDYTKLFATGNVPKRSDGKTMPYNEWIRSMGNMKGGQPKSVQELDYLINSQEQSMGRKMNNQERGKFIADNWYPNKRGAMQTEVQGVATYGQQKIGGGFDSEIVENSLPGEGGEFDSETGVIPNPKLTIEEASTREINTEARKEATVLESKNQQATDSTFRDTATELVQEMRQQLGNTLGLMEAIESGQFNESGPFEQYFKVWGNKESAELAADAMMQALLNLQITKLTPVTENEMAEIKKLYADVGKDPQANIGALTSAVRRITSSLRELQKKRDYWNDNKFTLKGYGIKSAIGGDEDWTSPLPSTYQADVPGMVRATQGGRKPKSTASYLEDAK